LKNNAEQVQINNLTDTGFISERKKQHGHTDKSKTCEEAGESERNL